MRCSVGAYEGKENYIFISYCHEDEAEVYPIIEQMSKNGYRLWYDEGIVAGSEWPETIANHLNECTVFVVLITGNSLNSHNCRREINFAIQKRKALFVLFLEKAQLSLGMQMLLSNVQQVFRDNYNSDIECLNELYAAPIFNWCKGNENPNVVVHNYDKKDIDNKIIDNFKNNTYDDIFIKNSIIEKDMPSVSSEELYYDPGTIKLPSDNLKLLKSSNDKKATQRNKERYLYRLDVNELIDIIKDNYSIGRAEADVDYIIKDDETISRVHAFFNTDGEKICLFDNNSVNNVFLNGKRIEVAKNVVLNNYDIIYIGKTPFIFIDRHRTENTVSNFALCSNAGICECVKPGIHKIGRNSNCDLSIAHNSVSKLHALIVIEEKSISVVDLRSSNGTFVNKRKIKTGTKYTLNIGDEIMFGRIKYIVSEK